MNLWTGVLDTLALLVPVVLGMTAAWKQRHPAKRRHVPDYDWIDKLERELGLAPSRPDPPPVPQPGYDTSGRELVFDVHGGEKPVSMDYDSLDLPVSYRFDGVKVWHGLQRVPRPQCVLLHRWQTVWNTGKNIYRECKRCGLREIMTFPGGFQPINRRWLAGASMYADDRLEPPLAPRDVYAGSPTEVLGEGEQGNHPSHTVYHGCRPPVDATEGDLWIKEPHMYITVYTVGGPSFEVCGRCEHKLGDPE